MHLQKMDSSEIVIKENDLLNQIKLKNKFENLKSKYIL